MKVISHIFKSGLVAALGMLVFAGTAYAQNGGMTVDHVAKQQRVYDAAISDDGNYVAYRMLMPKDPTQTNDRLGIELHVYNRETGKTTPFFTQGYVGNVAFRPDHNSLTFLSRMKGDKTTALYEMPLNGGGATKLYEFDRSIESYSWGAEGNRMVFTAKEAGAGFDSKLPYQPELYEEGHVNTKGFVVDLSNENAEARMLKVEGTIYHAKLSPQNDRILIAVAPTSKVDDKYMFQEVKVVDYQSLEVTAELEHEGKLTSVHWSPDGKQVALLAGNDIHDVTAGRIIVGDASGGAVKNINSGFKGKYEQIAWTAKNTIHFIASEGTATGVGSINADGSDMQYMLEPGKSELVYEGFAYADDQHIALVASTPNHPRELYYYKGKKPTRITNSNPWLEDVELGEQSLVTYEARDGLKLEGLLIKPVGYEEGTEVPLIVVAHGGPEAHHSNGWLTRYIYPGQVGAARGYAVFYPNYRGSTGRGIEFLKSSQGDAAGKEFDDIVDGVDHLIEEGIADPGRVAITGGSYGGYATGWMATKYSDRFAAGVMNFGISDNISKWGTTDIPMEMYLVHAREWLYKGNWQKYLDRSPIYHVDKSQTPLLITHGKEDTRVHPGQSMELYRHLKVRKPDVPVRLVWYPGEGHGYGGATARYDYNIRMMRWFDHFIMDEEDELPPMSVDDAVR